MNSQQNESLKSLLSQSLRERQDSYTIQRIFEQFPTTSELLDATEQQLTEIKGIGKSKARHGSATLSWTIKIRACRMDLSYEGADLYHVQTTTKNVYSRV
ncbi:hypothetical protein [Paenibacillus sp. KS-LC4]|uniref:hypothetical protein n=1 Tax=Paenibacillus sp. KS-LC4 TaxID=2979727 RepID=UPI0030D24B43